MAGGKSSAARGGWEIDWEEQGGGWVVFEEGAGETEIEQSGVGRCAGLQGLENWNRAPGEFSGVK